MNYHNGLKLFFLKCLDYTFLLVPLFFVFFWSTQTILTLTTTKNIYGATNLLLLGNTHSLTVLYVCGMYVILLLFTNSYLPIPIRVATATVFISLGIQFNGLIWSLLNLTIGSHTSQPLLNFSFFFLNLVILFGLNRKYSVVKIHKTFLLISIPIFLLSLCLFIQSRFFEAWYLCELGLGPDPHNWQWALEGLIETIMWLGLVRK